jgi:hypothetical protein
MLIDWSLESPDGRQTVLQLVSIIHSISACSGQYPTQETISEMPFGFWYIFQVRFRFWKLGKNVQKLGLKKPT